MKNLAKSKIVAGIEIGSTKVATVIAQINQDPVTYETTVNIVGATSFPSTGIRKGQIVDIDEAVGAVITSLESAEKMAGYRISSALVNFGGANIHSQNSHGVVAVSNPDGEIIESDVARVIEAASAISLPASREIIHVLPREYVVDGEGSVKDPIGMSGVRLEVDTHIITAASPAIKNLKKTMTEAGVEIEELVYTGLASSWATLTPTEKELGCVLIDIGGGTTSVAVFLEGSLAHSVVIPVGAKNVTNDLAIGLRVSLEAAEKIKISLSDVDSKDESDEINLAELGIDEIKKVSKKTLIEGIIRPRLNEIFTMVRLEIEKENLTGRIPSGAIVTGGGALTIGIIESARRMLQLPVRIGKPKGITGLIDDIVAPNFASVTGLVVYRAAEMEKPLTTGIKSMKLPVKGVFGKIISSIKDLLP